MLIERRVAQGYKLRCENGHGFLVQRLGVSVECPACGCVALTPELVTAFLTGPPVEREERVEKMKQAQRG